MRTADELIALALATGTYAAYVGDGATVPWGEIPPPAGFIAYTYKLYLDLRWPHAFKLHDWCYTPYGALIQVTREEADDALAEIIARDSIQDAVIVFAAVRLGGGPWFGVSMTGFIGANRPNIAEPGNERFSVPTKVVMLFKDEASSPNPALNRIGGWSESVYHASDDLAVIDTALKIGDGNVNGLLPARALLLPASGSIVGVRLYKGGAGKGVSQSVQYPGQATFPTDVPQMSLQMSARSLLTGGVRRWLLRAIPDQFVVTGTFAPNTNYLGSLASYKGALTQFSFYSQTATEVGFHINQIVAIPPVPPATVGTGLCSTLEPHSFAAGNQVTVYSTVKADGSKVTVQTRVLSVQSVNQLTLPNWTEGNTTGGILGSPLKTIDTFNFFQIQVGLISVRKVGRPFDLYRGRRSKRRAVV